jgi:hypothetical protein
MQRRHLLKYLQVALIALGLLIVMTISAQAAPPDPRFILQTTAGLAAYARITDTVALPYILPVFSGVDYSSDSYILGDYQLEGRPDIVKLLIRNDGWALTYQPSSQNSSRFYDCEGYPYTTQPMTMPNRLETALYEVSAALEVSRPEVVYYDFRYPQAEHLTLFWLLQMEIGNLSATLNLPLSNVYLEQGFGFCTVGSNSEFYINQTLIAEGNWVFTFGLLENGQLRPGQTNSLEVRQGLTIFGRGLMGGVAMLYEGDAPLLTDGGYRRDLTLAYPEMLGEPLTIHSVYLPVQMRFGVSF